MSTHTSTTHWLLLLTVLVGTLFLFAPSHPANAQSPTNVDAALGSTFNYQGRLNEGSNPATGSFDFQFILYDAASGGSQKGSTLKVDKVAVSNGLFNVPLDFGQAVIDGTALFLEVGVKPAGSASTYTVLSPRTGLNAVPYALGLPGVTIKAGLVTVATTLEVKGSLNVAGNEFVMLPTGRGDGGRAIVHNDEDRLTLNYANDFAGGVDVGSKMTVHGDITLDGAIKSQEDKPAFFAAILGDDCGGSHIYLGCPVGFLTVGQWHVGDSCDGLSRGIGYENGEISSGWMAMCAAN